MNVRTSDNVAACKSLYDKAADKVITIFSTYDGKLHYAHIWNDPMSRMNYDYDRLKA